MCKNGDLIGKRFGKLLVIEKGNGKVIGKKTLSKQRSWICLCDCGNKIEKITKDIKETTKTGKFPKSCGCAYANAIRYNFEDLTGKKFGKLTVIKKDDSIKIANKDKTIWLCKCKCGNKLSVIAPYLKNGSKKCCGCTKIDDLTGKKFNKLTIIKLVNKEETKRCERVWLCKCDCGKEVEFLRSDIINSKKTNCGDISAHYYDRFYKEIPICHINNIKWNAKKRNIEYNVTDEYLWDLFLAQNRKCALTGIELKFTKNIQAQKTSPKDTNCSLDRIDSLKGYIPNNVQWVYKKINVMKHLSSNEEFTYLARKIIDNYYFNNRPNWDEYFLNLAFNISYRSEDPNIKHGAIIVDDLNHISGTGYNAMITGAIHSEVPLDNRDEKRKWMIHAEENAILNCSRNTNNSKIYVTGEPCNNCLQRIINFGIKTVIIADRQGSITENEETRIMKDKIIKMSNIEIVKIPLKNLLLEF